MRARAARARSRKASSTSSTISSGASAANCARLSRATTARPAPALSAASTKSWPSRLSPWMAKKASPLAERAAVDGQAAARRRQRAGFFRAHGGGHGVDGPQRASCRPLSCKRRAPTASWSENGKMLVADDLAGLMALAGDQQHVAGLQRGDAGADRLARGRRSRSRRARRREWRRGSRPAARCADCRR